MFARDLGVRVTPSMFHVKVDAVGNATATGIDGVDGKEDDGVSIDGVLD